MWLVLGTALTLGVGACTAEPDEEGPSPDPPSVSQSPSGTAADADEDWDLDQDGLMAAYRSGVAASAESMGIDNPPEVDLVRFVSVDEWATIQVDCLAELGIGAQLGGQGGVVYDEVPQEQAETLELAVFTCESMFPVDPRTQQQLPRVRAVMQYQHLVGSVMPCVEELGFDVSTPPTQETWLDQYYSGGHAWDPYTDVASLNDSEALDQVYEECPHDAHDLYPPIESD